jgi:TetR/AcrR family transcriptional regulator, cholesterol catabolism regulator
VSREEIIDAAARVFLREGYRGATMDQVAREVRLRKASLYHHIRSKDSLLIELCEASLGYSVPRLRAVADDMTRSPCEKVYAATHQHVEILAARPGPSAAFTLYAHQIEDKKIRDRFLSSRADYFALMQCVVEGALKVHLKTDNPELVTYAVVGECNWMQHWYRTDGDFQAHEIADSFATLALRMVGCDGRQHAPSGRSASRRR